MTEDQIERHVERKVDRLDTLFRNGAITVDQYDREIENIENWAARKYLEAYEIDQVHR